MPSSSRLPELVLLLSICLTLIQCQEIKYIAVSADVTFHFGPCELNQVYKLQYSGVTAHIPCNSIHQIPLRFGDRISIDKTTGSITLRNVTSSDAGYYRLVRTNGNGKNENLPSVEVRVLDPIWIHELFHNYTDGTISLSRCHAENSGVIFWMIDGRDLLDRRWLSPDNRTLTIPYNYTGVITVSNLVSTDNKSITVIGDLNGESGNLGPVMDLSITTVIWGDGRDEPTKGTLILPRNISAIYILLTQSDETSETQWRSWKRFIYIAVMVVLIMLVIVCLFMDSLMRDEFPLLSFISKMNFLPMNHVTRKNVTLLQMDDAENSELWEPQTVIVVVIFGLVCVLHLTAFLYTVCLQSYVNGGAQTFPHPFHYRRQDKEKNVFYGLISPIFIDHEDSQTKERIPIMVDI